MSHFMRKGPLHHAVNDTSLQTRMYSHPAGPDLQLFVWSFIYRKNPKISDTGKFAVITLKVEQDAERLANSVDPDQSDLGLHCLPRPVCPKT